MEGQDDNQRGQGRNGEDVEGGGEGVPLLPHHQQPALPVIVRCLSSPWFQT